MEKAMNVGRKNGRLVSACMEIEEEHMKLNDGHHLFLIGSFTLIPPSINAIDPCTLYLLHFFLIFIFLF